MFNSPWSQELLNNTNYEMSRIMEYQEQLTIMIKLTKVQCVWDVVIRCFLKF